jgi:predicted nucleic acid-binding protein
VKWGCLSRQKERFGGMKLLRVYMDNCCFNRPYDEQTLLKIKLETQCKLNIQKLIMDKKIELIWSFIISYENAMNPFIEKRIQIAEWRKRAVIDCGLTDEILEKSKELMKYGLRLKDSLHVSCAVSSGADYFITSDNKIINKKINEIKIINPVEFVFLTEGSL